MTRIDESSSVRKKTEFFESQNINTSKPKHSAKQQKTQQISKNSFSSFVTETRKMLRKVARFLDQNAMTQVKKGLHVAHKSLITPFQTRNINKLFSNLHIQGAQFQAQAQRLHNAGSPDSTENYKQKLKQFSETANKLSNLELPDKNSENYVAEGFEVVRKGAELTQDCLKLLSELKTLNPNLNLDTTSRSVQGIYFANHNSTLEPLAKEWIKKNLPKGIDYVIAYFPNSRTSLEFSESHRAEIDQEVKSRALQNNRPVAVVVVCPDNVGNTDSALSQFSGPKIGLNWDMEEEKLSAANGSKSIKEFKEDLKTPHMGTSIFRQ